jgi:hypothetical protein
VERQGGVLTTNNNNERELKGPHSFCAQLLDAAEGHVYQGYFTHADAVCSLLTADCRLLTVRGR